MRTIRNKIAHEAEQTEAYSFESAVPEITAQPDDAILRLEYAEEVEPVPTQQPPSFFRRFLRFSLRAIAIVGLCGLAWAGGAFYSHNTKLFDALALNRVFSVQQNTEQDGTLGAIHDMADQIRVLETNVEALRAAQAAGAGDAATSDGLGKQLDTAQTATTAAIADLASRVDKLEVDSSTKLTQLGEQLDGLAHRLPAPRVAPTAAAVPRKKRTDQSHDAFDPSHAPGAPGTPLTLGNGPTAGQNGF